MLFCNVCSNGLLWYVNVMPHETELFLVSSEMLACHPRCRKRLQVGSAVPKETLEEIERKEVERLAGGTSHDVHSVASEQSSPPASLVHDG